jgi:hypothetical protein
MPFNKPHREFFALKEDEGWETAPGYPAPPPGQKAAVEQRILLSDLNDETETGSRTRLLKFNPGGVSAVPFKHKHWEEVYLIEGELQVGCDPQGNGGETFYAPTYACRPPGVLHGPFGSKKGCTVIEFHYYDESTKKK